MLAAAAWSFVGAASMLIGSIIALRWHISEKVIGLIMGFGAGTLISAVAFELTVDAYHEGGRRPSFLGLVAGALVFWGCDALLERRSARRASADVDVGEAEAAV